MAARSHRRRGAALRIDLGPAERFANGTAVMATRPDPDAPQGVDIRAARAFIRYEHMGLPEPHFLAARRVAEAAEVCSGAKDREGASVRSTAFWATGGPTLAALEAARYLREVTQVCGWARGSAVVLCVVDGDPRHEAEAREGLRIMAEWWGL